MNDTLSYCTWMCLYDWFAETAVAATRSGSCCFNRPATLQMNTPIYGLCSSVIGIHVISVMFYIMFVCQLHPQNIST